LLQAAAERRGETVLVARAIDQLFGQGPAGTAVGELLRPALEREAIRLLGTTTPEGVKKIQERGPTVLRLFTMLAIEEPTVEQAFDIVRGVGARFELHHKVQISESAIVAAVRLAKRYAQDRFLPDSALDLLDEAAARKRVEIDGMPAEVDGAIRRLESIKAQLSSL